MWLCSQNRVIPYEYISYGNASWAGEFTAEESFSKLYFLKDHGVFECFKNYFHQKFPAIWHWYVCIYEYTCTVSCRA